MKRTSDVIAEFLKLKGKIKFERFDTVTRNIEI